MCCLASRACGIFLFLVQHAAVGGLRHGETLQSSLLNRGDDSIE